MSRPILAPVSDIAQSIVDAVVTFTGLKSTQIVRVDLDAAYVIVTYNGPDPGMGGGAGRVTVARYSTVDGTLFKRELLP